MIETAIFDLGNVVLNFEHKSISERLARYSRYSTDEIYHSGLHSKQLRLYETGKIKSEELFQWLIEKFEIEISYETFRYIWSDIFSPNTSMETLLSRLKENGYRLILLSNTNELHFNFIKDNFEVIRMFDDLVLSYRIGYSKPHEKIYKEALRRAGSPAKKCVFIDDIKEFCISAESLGINSIVYRSTDQLIEELKKHGIRINYPSSV